MTPMPSVPKTLKGFEQYRLYEVSRQEDGRRRYRLRMGFFTTEADAELLLNSVRALYPTAFIGCVSNEDERFVRSAGHVRPAINIVTASEPVAKPVAAPPVAKPVAMAVPAAAQAAPQPAPAPVKTVAKPVKTEQSEQSVAPKSMDKPMETKPAIKPAETKRVEAKPAELSIRVEVAQATKPAPTKADDGDTQVFHVARGVTLPNIDLELVPEPAQPAAPAVAQPPRQVQSTIQPQPATAVLKPAVNKSATPAAKEAAPSAKAPAKPIAPVALPMGAPKVVDDYIPVLDTTMTVRTLTSTEREDPNQPTWFTVQLALSQQPVNLDTMPKLDIFAAYRLYSVALMEDGKIQHALRLGFFKESVSADAVAGYLKTFFESTQITRIAKAEYDRFAEPKPKPAPAAPAKVVELEQKRASTAPATTATATTGATTRPASAAAKPVHGKPATKPAGAPSAKPRTVAVNNTARPQSFFSRLIGRNLD